MRVGKKQCGRSRGRGWGSLHVFNKSLSGRAFPGQKYRADFRHAHHCRRTGPTTVQIYNASGKSARAQMLQIQINSTLQPSEIAYFWANPSTASTGNPATSGSINVNPSTTTTYILMETNSAGSTSTTKFGQCGDSYSSSSPPNPLQVRQRQYNDELSFCVEGHLNADGPSVWLPLPPHSPGTGGGY